MVAAHPWDAVEDGRMGLGWERVADSSHCAKGTKERKDERC